MRNGPDKNPFKSVSDLLFRASPASRTHHFLAYLIDIVLVFIVSYLLFLGGHSITINSKSYKNNYAKYTEEITYYQDMLVEAHVAEYLNRDDNLLADDEDLAIKMAISQVIYSASQDTSHEFSEDPMDKLKETYVGAFYQDAFTPISFENDYISKFFMEYVPTQNEKNTASTMQLAHEAILRGINFLPQLFQQNPYSPHPGCNCCHPCPIHLPCCE